jgi:hypothetical protein
MNRRRTVAVIILDLLVIAELCIAMYCANENREDFTLVFLKVFFGLLIPTFLLWRFVLRKLSTEKAETIEEEVAR